MIPGPVPPSGHTGTRSRPSVQRWLSRARVLPLRGNLCRQVRGTGGLVGGALVFIGFVGFCFGVVAWIRGRIGWARINSRKTAAFVVGGSVAVFAAGGALLSKPAPTSRPTAGPAAARSSSSVATPTTSAATSFAASAAPTPTSLPTTSTPASAAQYELGSARTAVTPSPDCSLAVADWTAALGPVSVSVNADGPTTVTVLINGRTSQTAVIAGGQTTHQFDFTLAATSVKTVKVTASSGGPGADEIGGSCMATGSPNA